MTLRVLALCLCLPACAGSFEEAQSAGGPRVAVLPGPGASEPAAPAAPPPVDPSYCRSLDSAHRSWGMIAKSSAVLAGGAGVAIIPVPADDKAARITIASIGIAAAAAAAGAVFASEDAAVSWARDCSK